VFFIGFFNEFLMGWKIDSNELRASSNLLKINGKFPPFIFSEKPYKFPSIHRTICIDYNTNLEKNHKIEKNHKTTIFFHSFSCKFSHHNQFFLIFIIVFIARFLLSLLFSSNYWNFLSVFFHLWKLPETRKKAFEY
jgi:hypothetical protein